MQHQTCIGLLLVKTIRLLYFQGILLIGALVGCSLAYSAPRPFTRLSVDQIRTIKSQHGRPLQSAQRTLEEIRSAIQTLHRTRRSDLEKARSLAIPFGTKFESGVRKIYLSRGYDTYLRETEEMGVELIYLLSDAGLIGEDHFPQTYAALESADRLGELLSTRNSHLAQALAYGDTERGIVAYQQALRASLTPHLSREEVERVIRMSLRDRTDDTDFLPTLKGHTADLLQERILRASPYQKRNRR